MAQHAGLSRARPRFAALATTALVLAALMLGLAPGASAHSARRDVQHSARVFVQHASWSVYRTFVDAPVSPDTTGTGGGGLLGSTGLIGTVLGGLVGIVGVLDGALPPNTLDTTSVLTTTTGVTTTTTKVLTTTTGILTGGTPSATSTRPPTSAPPTHAPTRAAPQPPPAAGFTAAPGPRTSQVAHPVVAASSAVPTPTHTSTAPRPRPSTSHHSALDDLLRNPASLLRSPGTAILIGLILVFLGLVAAMVLGAGYRGRRTH